MSNIIRRTGYSFLSLVQLKIATRYEEVVTELDGRVLDARRTRVIKQHQLAVAELTARREFNVLSGENEQAAYERTVWSNAADRDPNTRRIALTTQAEAERLLLGISVLRRQRLIGQRDTVQVLPHAPRKLETAAGAEDPPIGPHFSDAQIHALALKPLLRFANLNKDESERAWGSYHADLKKRFAPSVAEEIARRISELRAASAE